MGVKCSELCKCDDCKNCDQPPKKDCRKRVKNREEYWWIFLKYTFFCFKNTFKHLDKK